MLIPDYGIWFTLIALLPWGLRFLSGNPPAKSHLINWLLAIFLITAWIGYWAAYDKATAWTKVWLIVVAVLLYFALSAQPKENIETLSIISFGLGLGISIYFFLTHDFVVSQGRIMLWWMDNRPHVAWPVVHHGYISGLLVITGVFAVYWLRNIMIKPINHITAITKLFLVLGIGMIIWVLILTMSRGIWMAVTCGLGVWMVWKITASGKFATDSRARSLFPTIVLFCLSVVIIFVFIGPVGSGGDSTQNNYGTNTRAELFLRGTYFLDDYPITGGGLNSFPGLYSQYIIVIPFFYFINSYNMFLDVAIEQGLLGGLAFITIYLASVWHVSKKILNARSSQMLLFRWLGLFALIVTIVHGLLYDYLYNGYGVMLLFFPVGMSIMGEINLNTPGNKTRLLEAVSILTKSKIRMMIIVFLLGIIAILALNTNKMKSQWYANLGAIQMSRIELKDFPRNSWTELGSIPDLELAEGSLQLALQHNPNNQTANYRLGLISMLQMDYESAVVYLETAHNQAPKHRGIIKTLGYSYVWLGNLEQAQEFLSRIPEAQEELGVYVWWWETQGRNELSKNASSAVEIIEAEK